MFKLYLNTLDSGVVLRYEIVDHLEQVVFSSGEMNDKVIEFSQINPTLDPLNSSSMPFRLDIYY
jgi:hypothetical protein